MMIAEIKKMIKKSISTLLGGAYHIGFCINDEIVYNKTDWYKKISWVNTKEFDDEGWFADPFFLRVNEEIIILLAEEFVYSQGKGRLVKLTIDRKTNTLIDVYVVLELDTHLSFPSIYREDGKIYVIPENSASGGQYLYEYDDECSTLKNPKLIVPRRLLDPQLLKIEGFYFLFAVEFIEGWWEETQVLKIFRSKSLAGVYEEVQTIKKRSNEERGAGQIVNMVRPAQCCEGNYGKETILYKLYYRNDLFSELEIGRIIPNAKHKYGSLLHTYNVEGNIAVIDGYADWYPFWGKLYKKIRGIKQ